MRGAVEKKRRGRMEEGWRREGGEREGGGGGMEQSGRAVVGMAVPWLHGGYMGDNVLHQEKLVSEQPLNELN